METFHTWHWINIKREQMTTNISHNVSPMTVIPREYRDRPQRMELRWNLAEGLAIISNTTKEKRHVETY
jgi:diketogulonate reductase-like aldo/keto reductase